MSCYNEMIYQCWQNEFKEMSRYTGNRNSNMTAVINLNILNVYNLKQN
jgi:hypothetical protein